MTANASLFIRQLMQETIYQTADARDFNRQQMLESLYQTADAGVSISDSGCMRLYITDSG